MDGTLFLLVVAEFVKDRIVGKRKKIESELGDQGFGFHLFSFSSPSITHDPLLDP